MLKDDKTQLNAEFSLVNKPEKISYSRQSSIVLSISTFASENIDIDEERSRANSLKVDWFMEDNDDQTDDFIKLDGEIEKADFSEILYNKIDLFLDKEDLFIEEPKLFRKLSTTQLSKINTIQIGNTPKSIILGKGSSLLARRMQSKEEIHI